MGWIVGFDDEVLEALESDDDLIRCHAVRAAGSHELESAWPYVVDVIAFQSADKALLLAAIEAAPLIRPQEAEGLLDFLLDSEDEDVSSAAEEAIFTARFLSGEGFDDLTGDDMTGDDITGDDFLW